MLAGVKDKPAVALKAPSLTAAARDNEDFMQAGTEGSYRSNKRLPVGQKDGDQHGVQGTIRS